MTDIIWPGPGAGPGGTAVAVAGGDLPRVLIVEDDLRIIEELREYLENDGYDVHCSLNGFAVADLVAEIKPDAIVLDVGLPGQDGLQIVRGLRERGMRTPVIFCSGRGGEGDRVRGLRAGGDDYMVKPFSLVELSARIHALLRRSAALWQGAPARDAAATGDAYLIGTGRVDFGARTMTSAAGETAKLNERAALLLQTMLRLPQRTFTLAELADAVRVERVETIRVIIHRLKAALGGDAAIRTVYAVGYKLGPKIVRL